MIDLSQELGVAFSQLLNTYSPRHVDRVDGGLAFGVAGIAYLLYYMDRFNLLPPGYSDIDVQTQFFLYFDTIRRKRFVEPRGNHCGMANDMLAILMLEALVTNDDSIAEESINQICAYADEIAQDYKASNEWLYGRAGLLYHIRTLLHVNRGGSSSFGRTNAWSSSIEAKLSKAGSCLVEAMLNTPRPWVWRDSEYMGAVHGYASIITQILLFDSSYLSNLEEDLLYVLSLQLPSGNWPSSKHSNHDRLVQFCHGAPGVIASLKTIRYLYATNHEMLSKLDKAIQRGEACVKQRGILSKEPCLCHGTIGNAISLEPRERLPFFEKATEAYIASHAFEHSSAKASLYNGIAGRVWGWLVTNHSECLSGFLGYNESYKM